MSGQTNPALPQGMAGRWAIGFSAFSLVIAVVVLPAITSIFAEKYPVTNTGLMPSIGAVLMDLALVFDILCLLFPRQRGTLLVVATVVTAVPGIFFTLSLTL